MASPRQHNAPPCIWAYIVTSIMKRCELAGPTRYSSAHLRFLAIARPGPFKAQGPRGEVKGPAVTQPSLPSPRVSHDLIISAYLIRPALCRCR
ncbi:hypothetical protein PIB30_035995 [Stylosanthes scabra]|uniref:Uncharacterized protein n=1 Tax=Stylosanthes scabra TaxID=79078 RepID=A0ABU6UC24_9FABA|nr:hypothetical protein [Stylosanthes scabra]